MKKIFLKDDLKKTLVNGAVIGLNAVFSIAADIWLCLWASDFYQYPNTYYLMVYAILNIFASSTSLLQNLVVRRNLAETMNTIHLKCIEKLFQSKLTWFMDTKSRETIEILTENQNKIDSGFVIVMVSCIECVIYLFVGLTIFNY